MIGSFCTFRQVAYVGIPFRPPGSQVRGERGPYHYSVVLQALQPAGDLLCMSWSIALHKSQAFLVLRYHCVTKASPRNWQPVWELRLIIVQAACAGILQWRKQVFLHKPVGMKRTDVSRFSIQNQT